MKNPEGSRMFIKEHVIPVALSVASVCSAGAKPFEQQPFMSMQPQQTAQEMYMSQAPERKEVHHHPLSLLLEKSTKQDLNLVGLEEKDKPAVIAGLLTHGEKRSYGNDRREVVFFTNTDILDNGFRIKVSSFLPPQSIFSAQDIQKYTARLLPELTARFGLSAVTVSSIRSANCDLHVGDIQLGGAHGKNESGIHPTPVTKRRQSPFGIFQDTTLKYAWTKLHDYRDVLSFPVPVEVIKEFGIDLAVKAAVHELVTHKILGQNHSTAPGDISNANIGATLRDSRDIKAHRKPWSHVYTSKDGNEYIANFQDGDPLDDQTNKIVRFLHLVRMKEKE